MFKLKNHKNTVVAALENVSPDHIFFVHDGSTLSNIHDLLNSIKNMPDDIFFYHANEQKNDFSNWINDVLKDSVLAKKIKSMNKINTAKEIEARIKFWEKKKK